MMDTTPEYIRMCEAAPKLREGYKYQEGDWYYADNLPFGCWIMSASCLHVAYDPEQWTGNPAIPDLKRVFPVWRQDQLQAMADEWWLKCGTYGRPLIEGIYRFAMSFNPQPFREHEMPVQSWEQLWLAAIMEWKYHKAWNGSEWQPKADNA